MGGSSFYWRHSARFGRRGAGRDRWTRPVGGPLGAMPAWHRSFPVALATPDAPSPPAREGLATTPAPVASYTRSCPDHPGSRPVGRSRRRAPVAQGVRPCRRAARESLKDPRACPADRATLSVSPRPCTDFVLARASRSGPYPPGAARLDLLRDRLGAGSDWPGGRGPGLGRGCDRLGARGRRLSLHLCRPDARRRRMGFRRGPSGERKGPLDGRPRRLGQVAGQPGFRHGVGRVSTA